jgi:hypothetical protein
MSTTQTATGFVYLIRDNDTDFKVGASADPWERIKHVAGDGAELLHVIRSANPFQIERAFHRLFAEKRCKARPGREWFNLSNNDIVLFVSIVEAHTLEDLPFRLPENIRPSWKLDVTLHRKASTISAFLGMSLGEWVDSKLRPIIEKEFADMARKIQDDEEDS